MAPVEIENENRERHAEDDDNRRNPCEDPDKLAANTSSL